MCCGEGLGIEGGVLAGAGGRAAENNHLFGEGAGAGERAAQQGGTESTDTSRLVLPLHQHYSSSTIKIFHHDPNPNLTNSPHINKNN